MAEPRVNEACIVIGGRRESPPPAHPTRACVIDLGTNSFHTLIVDAYPNGSFKIVDKLKEMVRLGEEGLDGSRLTEAAMERAVAAMRRARTLAEGWNAREYLAFGTSAIREADNGGALIDRMRDATDIRARAISGDMEARLIYQGVRRAVDMDEPTLVMDIGGGSTEFVVAHGDEVAYEVSLKLGAARMTRQFLADDPTDREGLKRLKNHYRNALAPVREAVQNHGVRRLVGSSGTMENLAAVCANVQGTGDESIFLTSFEAGAFRSTAKRVARSSIREREAMNGIDPKRVDQIGAGALLAEVAIAELELEAVRISPFALREGMVVHFIQQNSRRLESLAPYGDVRRRGVHEVGFRFEWDRQHAEHVTAMALQLFDACRGMHGLGGEARELLEYAALLHDIGYYISRRAHHKHTLYLIQQVDWQGFQPEEVAVMANVARYHRRSLPKDKHSDYSSLSKKHRRLVDQLASFLRIANGLDRSHYQNVVQLRAHLTDEALTISVHSREDPQLEVWGGQRGADLFRRTFGRPVRIVPAQMEHRDMGNDSSVKDKHLLT